ncbi:uncharacterized protein LOC142785139 isoform X1 [Rhipicephalus microplus]|uniref:uncharacterized protein LOC142785139 isoform X1 n=1 Tax=Rhipicephalus microplus TaxID=6941 RepID=UPI0023765616
MTITYHCRFIVILVLCTAAHAVQVGDLYRALDTNESVWMLKRNYTRPNHTCVRATKMFLNLTDYQFNQTFLNNTAKESELLNAKLGCDMKHEYMNVSKTQGGVGIQYTLQSWNDTKKCGILTFVDPYTNETQCELYQWGSHVNRTPNECDSEYNNTCKGNATQVYFSNCTSDAMVMC